MVWNPLVFRVDHESASPLSGILGPPVPTEIACHFHLELSQAVVSRKLSIHKGTVGKLFKCMQDAAHSSRLECLIQHISKHGLRGHQPLVQPGSVVSLAVREHIRDLKHHESTEAASATRHRKPTQGSDVIIPQLRPSQVMHVIRDSELRD